MSALETILSQPKITHDLVQGSPAWEAFRLQHWGASEAAALLGLSKNMTRTEVLQAKHTGIAREFTDFVQKRVLDKGHEVEARARPIIEAQLGEDLYPVTCSRGRVSASCDGIDLGDDTAIEHKQWAEELAASVAAGVVPDEHMPQCQQILMVTGARRVLFVVSNGTAEKMVQAEVLPDSAWWERIAAAAEQADRDLAVFVPLAAQPPKPTGRAPDSLPALRIELTGAVMASNLAEFKATALGAIRSVNRELATDQHFADAEQAVKWCGEIESRIKAAKDHALSQTATIDELFRTLDDVSTEARKVRLDLEKLVERRKVEIKGELVAAARSAYERHVAALKQDTGDAWINLLQPDFGGAIKGKRSFDGMRDALDTAVANAKIAADESARKIRAALAAFAEAAAGHEHLFADRLSFITKAPEDVRLLVRARITEHQAAEQRRADELAEKAREKIRAEEAEKADAAARARFAAEQAETARVTARLQREQQEKDVADARQREAVAPTAPAGAVFARTFPGDSLRFLKVEPPAPAVVQMPVRAAAAPSGPPTLRLGDIQKHLAPFSVTAEGLRQLGFEPSGRQGAAVLYRNNELDYVLTAAIQHLMKAREQLAKVA